MYALSASLDSLGPYLDERLVTRAALARLRMGASRLPAAISDRLFLECRLHSDESRTDLIAGIEARGMGMLAGGDAGSALDPALALEESWARVRDLCRFCLDPGGRPRSGLRCLWLEFDFPGRGAVDGVPAPGVFLDFSPSRTGARPAPVQYATIAAALRILRGGELPGATILTLNRCFRCLPAGAYVPYLGVLLPRGADTVRVCVMGLRTDQAGRYLRSIGWPGSAATLDEPLSWPASRDGFPSLTVLNLDVGVGIGPQLGLEYAFARAGQARGALREVPFLDHLVERGWCDRAKREALLTFPGCAVEHRPHELWPSVSLRHIAHVKLVHDGAGVREAKAYLRVVSSPRTVRSRDRRQTLRDRDPAPNGAREPLPIAI